MDGVKCGGIQIHSTRVGDHPQITQLLNEGRHEYHIFKIPEEKTLWTVLRAILQVPPTDEVKKKLLYVEFE